MGDIHWFRFFQISLTFAVGLFTHFDILHMCFNQWSVLKRELKDKKLDDQAMADYKSMDRANLLILVMGASALLFIVYSMLQFTFSHFCAVSLWNMKGCVDQ